MSSEFKKQRQRWYNTIKPGDLVKYDSWGQGYNNKIALILSIQDKFVNTRGMNHKDFTILVNQEKRTVHQELVSPLDGWENIEV